MEITTKKRTISTTNQHFNSPTKRKKMIIDAVYSSAKIEGSKITKKKLTAHYDVISKSSH
jgi:Fic family protein